MTTIDRPDANGPDANGPGSNRPGGNGPESNGPGSNTAVEVVRSEERLNVGTVVRVSGRAVLRRYVVTETVTQTFQVRHEEFRVDHEPLPDDGRTAGEHVAGDERAFADRFVETVLHREVPVVTMQVVAAERVRVHVDTITERVDVSDSVAQERIDVDVLDQPGTRSEA
jgi:stress response protein YsnF